MNGADIPVCRCRLAAATTSPSPQHPNTGHKTHRLLSLQKQTISDPNTGAQNTLITFSTETNNIRS